METRTVVEKVLAAISTDLIAGLNCKSGILDYLVSHASSVLTSREREAILSKKTRREQNQELVSILMSKNEDGLDHLHSYLKRNGYIALVNRLEKASAEHGHTLSGVRGYNNMKNVPRASVAPEPPRMAVPIAERSSQPNERVPPSNSGQERRKKVTSFAPGLPGFIKSLSGGESTENYEVTEDHSVDDRLEVRL